MFVFTLVLSYCCRRLLFIVFFFFTATPTPDIYTLSLHDALPISLQLGVERQGFLARLAPGRTEVEQDDAPAEVRSEEHTSELQSHHDLVCRLLLEKKKNHKKQHIPASIEPRIFSTSPHP